ncbi:MAG TPA: SAM-dependent methyltransferase [Muribaculum sp.]|jgi:16S rRNA (cytidine1402-2'-O)-methyltransferase|uniref:SAM-dependent methyltransferase n=1 Tax=Heminiphilus faecis TaxID=2601703 RepID=A0ABV4CUX4_9BACT|nr:SAM-dependent methyltransferase [Heminiphilus faecis]RLT75746.1 SAM-dependent methyltransferase [bacterium J10(2018)]HRF69286.1 SAM-dependent methyltransferase [Muribaculum sp.]
MDKVPAVYLIPVMLGDTDADRVLPSFNLDIIRGLRYFIVENLRSARRFLKRCDRSIDIDSLVFAELNEHTPAEAVSELLAPAEAGHDVGVISEAGCPAVADPGADVVAIAQQRGYKVVPLVGPSSILMSLMGSGFNGQSFAFNGYLPIDAGARTAKLKEMERRIRHEHQTQIFIETPYRNNRLISELSHALPGAMKLCVASDITGERESIVTRPLSYWKNASYNYDKIPTIFLLYK